MGEEYGSELHPNDFDLVEGILSREADPHLEACASCRARRDALAGELDPACDDGPFDDVFYSRQAARIRGRIEEAGLRRSWWAFLGVSSPRLAWGGAALASLLVAAFFLAPTSRVEPPLAVAGSLAPAEDVMSAEDLEGDRLLREIDALIAEDPYDFELFDENWEG